MFTKFPSINNPVGVQRRVADLATYDVVIDSATYHAKVKLHGTNAGVNIAPDGEVRAQSRSRLLNGGQNDNMGFAAWVEARYESWARLAYLDFQVTVFGEWCGQGIQKKVAISDIGKKIFAVFSIQIGDKMWVDPTEIEASLGLAFPDGLPDDIFVLPWYGEKIEITFRDQASVTRAAEHMEETVAEVERMDPWVKEVFDVEGIGEGLVYYPVSMAGPVNQVETLVIDRDRLSDLMFKAKGEKHQVIKSKKLVVVDEAVTKSVNEFVDVVVTDARLEQGFVEGVDSTLDNKMIGRYIGWIAKDVKKDVDNQMVTVPEGIEWRACSIEITNRARKWYIDKINEAFRLGG